MTEEHQEGNSTDFAGDENKKQSLVVVVLSLVLLGSTLVWYLQAGLPDSMWNRGMLAVVCITAGIGFWYAYFLRQQTKLQELNYRQLFYIGLLWAAVGLFTDILPLLLVGGSFVIFGLHNRYRWSRKDVAKEIQQKKAKRSMVFGVFVMLAATAYYFLFS